MYLRGKMIGFIATGLMAMAVNPISIMAAENAQVERQTRTTLTAYIDAPQVSIYSDSSKASEVTGEMNRGEICEVVERSEDGWIRVNTGSGQGYLQMDKAVTLVETASEVVDRTVARRKQIIDYAMQFVGGRYVYGGTNPNTGVDCSGFTRYVMEHAAGISIPRSSSAQASAGSSISFEEVLPGDLLFYGGKNYINHVAIYIGNGQIVHASTAKTGIKVSNATYRTPVKVVRLVES